MEGKGRRRSGVILTIENFWAPHASTGAAHTCHITSWRLWACLARHRTSI